MKIYMWYSHVNNISSEIHMNIFRWISFDLASCEIFWCEFKVAIWPVCNRHANALLSWLITGPYRQTYLWFLGFAGRPLIWKKQMKKNPQLKQRDSFLAKPWKTVIIDHTSTHCRIRKLSTTSMDKKSTCSFYFKVPLLLQFNF